MIRIGWLMVRWTWCQIAGHQWTHMNNLHAVCRKCTALKEWD
jgi:hypothetical protein